jgi:hypothetical protein
MQKDELRTVTEVHREAQRTTEKNELDLVPLCGIGWYFEILKSFRKIVITINHLLSI